MQNAECRMQNWVRWLSAFCILHSAFALACAAHRDTREPLTFWALGAEGDQIAPIVAEFERQNPSIHVVMQQIPWTAAHEKLLTAIDELHFDARDHFAGVWATNVVDGKLYGVPWYVDTRVLFYRSDVLAAVGYPHAPRTWDEWRDAMQRIERERRARFAILLPTNEFEPILMRALSSHATLLTPDGTRGAFERPEFVRAFTFYVEAFRRGWAPSVSNQLIANLYQQFAQGDFAMYITGPWNVGEFKRKLPPEMQDKWATAPLPALTAAEPFGVSMAGGSSLVIFRGARHRAAAEKLIAFLEEPAQQVRLYEITGDLPARRSAWASPALVNDPHFAAFREQLERVAPMPKVPEWEQIATAVADRGEAAARNAG